jgi:hypothetical protein
MDYSKVSTEDLKNYQAGNTAGISTEGLRLLTAQQPAQAPASPAQVRGQKIDSYLAETDKMLGLTAGTSARQINQESRFDDAAFNEGSGARGISQVIEETRASLSKRFGRQLDSHNTDDALFMHRELMKENMGKWGNESDALRAYNSGWTPANWDNDETNGYIDIIMGSDPEKSPMESTGPAKGGGANPILSGYAPVPEDMKETDLDTNQDFLVAAEQMYIQYEAKNFVGSDADLAEWGKTYIWDFNNNLLNMGFKATQVIQSGTQEEKEALVYMMEAFDNTNISLAGTWRSVKAASWDPANLPVLASLGIGTVGKVLTVAAAKEGVKKALLTSLGRTGIIAGVEVGALGAADSSIRQYVKVDAGVQDEFSNTQLAVDTTVSATLGLVMGTGGDLFATKMAPIVARKFAALKEWIKPSAPDVKPVSTVGNTAGVTYNPASGLPLSPEDAARVAQANSVVPVVGAEDVPMATPSVNPAESIAPSTRLPVDLAKAKPKWKTSGVVFESDIDKALYITAQRSPSRRDPDYRKFLREHGFTQAEIDVGGLVIRRRINEIGGKQAAGATLVVPKGEGSKWVDPASLGPSTGPASGSQVSSNRRQKGRQWVDDLPPITPANREASGSLSVPNSGEGLRGTPRDHKTSRANGVIVEKQLENMTNNELQAVVEGIRLDKRTPEDFATISLGVEFHAKKVSVELNAAKQMLKVELPVDEYAKTLERVALLEDRLIPLALADEAIGSISGSILNQRKIGGDVVPSVAKLMEDGKITKPEAEVLFERLHAQSRQDEAVQTAMIPHNEAIDAAIKVGDSAEILRLQAVRRMELEGIVETIIPKGASIMARAAEIAISNVLSTTSVMINVAFSAPFTLATPALSALVNNPLRRATRIRLAGAYSSMVSMRGHTLRASLDALRYEQLIASRDSFKLLDGPMANTGLFGSVVRTIPRIMASMDEFLTQLNYTAYVGGEARERAYLEAVEQGMSPKLTKAHMKAQTAKALAGAFSADSPEVLLQPIVNKGVNRGYRGEELSAWVVKETQKMHALEPATHKDALNMARDLLYQRKWSKSNFWSKTASTVENVMQEYPGFRLAVGQLFFRTPIRVFEQGVRMTPGLQFLAPNYMKDLAGGNGESRQLRAQSESLLSVAFMAWGMTQYVQGDISGQGGSDSYKQQRLKTDLGGEGAYSLGDTNSKWGYRNFDPVAFPLKTLTTGMELMDKMHTRQNQGDAPDQSQVDQVMAHIYIAMQSVTMAIKDANLVQGLSTLIDAGDIALDPESSDSAIMRLLQERLTWVYPSTLAKIARWNDPTLKDPATYWQVVEQQLANMYIDLSGVKTSYSYDVFGNVRTNKETGRLYNIFSTTSQEEREGTLTPDEIYVGQELTKLSKVTGAIFDYVPKTHSSTGDLDMRTLMTEDGKETLYDRWNNLYRQQGPQPVSAALALILKAPLPDGTFKNKGPRVAEVRSMINLYREAAFLQMMITEQVVLDRYNKEIMDESKAKAGISKADWFN